MIIHIKYRGLTNPIYIFVNKSEVKISHNPTIDEASLRAFNIPNNALGKQVWFWIWVEDTDMNVIFSGISAPINISDIILEDLNHTVYRLEVDDNPFTKKRGLS